MKKFIFSLIIFLTAAAIFPGCGGLNAPQPPQPPEASEAPAPESSFSGLYDSMDTAIVETVDTDNNSITFINYTLDKTYTLEYTGATVITDKYDMAMSIRQIEIGDIVDICFLKDPKKLVRLKLSPVAFAYENVTKYSFNSERKSALIGGENYRLQSGALIISDGRKIDTADIIARDIVTIRGIDRDILSVTVQKGHGYLRLMNDAYAIGGWIEVGQTIIQRITDGMLLTVPEGTADVYISARGFSAARKVTVERNKETVIDLGDEEVIESRKGKVVFNITPAAATVYVDGEEVNTAGVTELDFGLHQVVCEAAGYDTVTQYIKVSQEVASVSIVMDETGKNPDVPKPDNGGGDSVSGNSLSIGASRVYIDAPAGVEVYVDGVYAGITPAYFEKKSGSHTITLRREGFITKSYTVALDGDPGDVTYSFSALEENLDNNN